LTHFNDDEYGARSLLFMDIIKVGQQPDKCTTTIATDDNSGDERGSALSLYALEP